MIIVIMETHWILHFAIFFVGTIQCDFVGEFCEFHCEFKPGENFKWIRQTVEEVSNITNNPHHRNVPFIDQHESIDADYVKYSILLSPEEGMECFSLWLHAEFSECQTSLNVVIESKWDKPKVWFWNESFENNPVRWEQVQVEIEGSNESVCNLKIIIANHNSHKNVAIDEVTFQQTVNGSYTISNDTCGGSSSAILCNFEEDLCDFQLFSDTNDEKFSWKRTKHQPTTHLNCNFEHGMCQWKTNVVNGKFLMWKIVSGEEIDLEGPKTDFNLSTSGHYLLAATTGHGGSTDGLLHSDTLSIDGENKCFHFWFSYMEGDGAIESLRIFQVNIPRNTRELIWKLESNSVAMDQIWTKGVIPIIADKSVKIIFDVNGGGKNNNTGWVALDEFMFMDEAECTIAPTVANPNYDPGQDGSTTIDPQPSSDLDCDFQTDLCSWELHGETYFKRVRGQDIQDNYGNISGPLEDHLHSTENYFLNADISVKDQTGNEYYLTWIRSRNLDGTKALCFNFWFSIQDIEFLAIRRKDVDVGKLEWQLNFHDEITLPFGKWIKGQVQILPSMTNTQYWIEILVKLKGRIGGFVSLDDFHFTTENCSIVIPSEATPNLCRDDEFLCWFDQSCISQTLVCDFKDDCSHGDDELKCPSSFLFDTCQDPMCYWVEQPVGDGLDWIVMKGSSNFSGPHDDSKFLFLSESVGQKDAIGRIMSPVYRNSASSCELHFLYYIWSGNLTNGGGSIILAERLDYTDVPLDYLHYFDQRKTWTERRVQIGRNRHQIQLVFRNEKNHYNTAIKDIQFVACDTPLLSTSCDVQTQFQCLNKVCIGDSLLCDGMDDCGDESDEDYTSTCKTSHKITFDDPLNPWGNFELISDTSLSWTRSRAIFWNKGKGPTFDHSTFKLLGFYLHVGGDKIVVSDNTENQPKIAKIISPWFKSDTKDKCMVHFYYHNLAISPDVGNLTFYLLKYSPNTDKSVMKVIWKSRDAGQNVWNRVHLEHMGTEVESEENSFYAFIFEASLDTHKYKNLVEGDIAIDDVIFSSDCMFAVEGPTTAGTLSTTPSTTPSTCPNDFQCTNGICISQSKVCNFISDCDDGSDEWDCPTFFTFNNCKGDLISNCYWKEEIPDSLDWISIKTDEFSNCSCETSYGPFRNHQNKTDGGFAFISAPIDDFPNSSSVTASMSGPIYQDSDVNCRLEFWYYYNRGQDNIEETPLIPYLWLINNSSVANNDQLIPLDYLGSTNSSWVFVKIGLGRRQQHFKVLFSLTLSKKTMFHVGVAVDDIILTQCGLPPEELCTADQFRCLRRQACIANKLLCDLSDDCGDNSDETLSKCKNLLMENFESFNLGIFTHNTSPDVYWRLSVTNVTKGLPPYDHSTFTPGGHFIYISNNNNNNNNSKLYRLISPDFHTPTMQTCDITLYYYIHGSNSARLAVLLLRHEEGEELELGMVKGHHGVMWNRWMLSVQGLGINVPYKIIVEATFSESKGTPVHIAIDDFVFHENCIRHETTVSTTEMVLTTQGNDNSIANKPGLISTFVFVSIILLLLVLAGISLLLYRRRTSLSRLTAVERIRSFVNPLYNNPDEDSHQVRMQYLSLHEET